MKHLAYSPSGVLARKVQLTGHRTVDLGMVARDYTGALRKVFLTEDLIFGEDEFDALLEASVCQCRLLFQ